MRQALVVLVTGALIVSVAAADDLIPPPWERGTPGSTFQEWTFDGPPAAGDGYYLPEAVDNPFGDPVVYDPYYWDGDWLETFEGRTGVIHPWDWIEIHLPNDPTPRPTKEIYIQITYWADGEIPDPDVYVPAGGDTITLLDSLDLEDGWWYDRWHITIEPNPDFEEIDFWPLDGSTYDMYIDQIVVDTICIPEPGALSLLALGGLVFLRRR